MLSAPAHGELRVPSGSALIPSSSVLTVEARVGAVVAADGGARGGAT
eukprot:gene54589-5765_t